MKKYLISGLFISGLLMFSPFLAKAQTAPLTNPAPAPLLGFLDGNMYDPVTGVWQCLFLMDNNCYDVNQNILTTRPAPAVSTPVVAGNGQTLNFPTNSLAPVPQAPASQTSPIINQPTATQTPMNKPAYTEDQLVSVLQCRNGLISLIINITTSSAVFSPCISGGNTPFNNVTVNFQGQNIFTNGVGQTPYGNRDWAQILGLSADTDYSWTLTYIELGRDNTIITKTFHTPNQ